MARWARHVRPGALSSLGWSRRLGAVVGRDGLFCWLLAGTFFVLFYLYLREYLDPRLLYYAHGVAVPSGEAASFPVFFRGGAFLGGFLGRPGGLTEYLAAYGCQYYYYPNLGPLLLCGLAAMAWGLTGWLIRLGGGSVSRALRYAAPLLLLAAWNQYTLPLEGPLTLVVALATAVAVKLAAVRLPRAFWHFPLIAALAGCAYYVAGGTCLLLAAWCSLPELLSGRRYAVAAAYCLAAVGIPLGWAHFSSAGYLEALLRPSGMDSMNDVARAVLLAAYLLVGLVVALLPVAGWARRRVAAWPKAAALLSGKRGGLLRSAALRRACFLLVLAAAAGWVAHDTLDREARKALRVNYLARTGQWAEFLAAIDGDRPLDPSPSLMVDINRALFETGQLGSRMFAYPQSSESLFALGQLAASYRGGCDVLLSLGCVNEAEHAALEALEIEGPRPTILRQLATIYLVKGQHATARVFLNRLNQDVVEGQWARDHLARLDRDGEVPADAEVQRFRSLMPQVDTISMGSDSKEILLRALVARNPRNRMAVEYLLAQYLLMGRAEEVACNIGRLEPFHEPTIPDHYAEAVLLFAHNVGGERILGTSTSEGVSRQARDRVADVVRTATRCGKDKDALAAALREKYPDSCSRYLLTGKSGDAR